MSMFDYYEPDPLLTCLICGARLSGWQGYEGPCGLFVWRQGHAHPVGQMVDEDALIDPMEYPRFGLPPWFQITTWCSREHRSVATCEALDGTWATTTVDPMSEVR